MTARSRPGRRGRVVARVVLPAALLPVLSGCGGSSSGEQSAPPPTPTAAVTPTCPAVTSVPSPSASAARELRLLPPGLPMPPSVTVVDAQRTSDGVAVVRFTTPTTLRDSVLFIVGRYPKAGYLIGRGDAEATEADAPFVHGQVRGLTRVAQVQQCQTLWLVASVAAPAATSPLLSPHPTSSATTALPFG